MYNLEHNLNPRVFDNTFTVIHHGYSQGFLEAILNGQK